MPEYTKTTPRTAKQTSVINPNLQFCIAEKGGISVYGLQRFPITLFWSQWQELFAGVEPDGTSLYAELHEFAAEHTELLSTKETATASDKSDDKPEQVTLNSRDIAAVAAMANTVKESNPNRYAELLTIKTFADMNKGKVPRLMGIDALNVRLQADKDKIAY